MIPCRAWWRRWPSIDPRFHPMETPPQIHVATRCPRETQPRAWRRARLARATSPRRDREPPRKPALFGLSSAFHQFGSAAVLKPRLQYISAPSPPATQAHTAWSRPQIATRDIPSRDAPRYASRRGPHRSQRRHSPLRHLFDQAKRE